MSIQALTPEQNDDMDHILQSILDECKASAIAVCGLDGNILSERTGVSSVKGFSLTNIAALAIGSFAATKALANVIGESSFKSVFQKGRKSGILIYELNDDFLILMLFGEKTTEGLARLYLKKITPKLETLLDDAEGQTTSASGLKDGFEVKSKSDA